MSTENSKQATESEISHITPPSSLTGILSQLGPGLIIAGSIVGSGELIGTTLSGAKAGFTLLWLILIGCIVKVWVQVELGRYTMLSGNTTMDAMNNTPGPAIHFGKRRVNWLACYWLLMFISSLGQLGGIVGGVGQSLAIAFPLTSHGREYNQLLDSRTKMVLEVHRTKHDLKTAENDTKTAELQVEIARLQEMITTIDEKLKEKNQHNKTLAENFYDEKIWAALVTLLTSVLLVLGRYKIIEILTTILVATFTLLSVVTVVCLQLGGEYSFSLAEISSGLTFALPPVKPNDSLPPLMVALAAFGIIGVGANELIQYPYWVQEKGYARFTGHFEDSPGWFARARGWFKVLQYDCWCSMCVYTFATIAFYLLGASVLARLQLVPKDEEMIRTLAVMYEPIFGSMTAAIFLIGAVAVLYSTFLIANAGHARVCTDAVRVFLNPQIETATSQRTLSFFNALFPIICFALYVLYPKPQMLILISGAMQMLMLPMLAFTAIYFRYTQIHKQLAPGKFWDICLWLSAVVMLFTAFAGIWAKGSELLAYFMKS
jgi:Mn2+/Fe2+ NRAMP family transporter